MRTRIESKTIVKFVEKELKQEQLWSKNVYDCSMEKNNSHINKILEAVKRAKSITLELASDDLPDEVFDALKWLNYYQFYAHIIVASSELFNKYKVCSNNTVINIGVQDSIIIIRLDNRELVYRFGKDIKKCEMVSSNSKNTITAEGHLIDFTKDVLILKAKDDIDLIKTDSKKVKTSQLIHVSDVSNQLHDLAKGLYIFEGDKVKQQYIIQNNQIYDLMQSKNRLIISEIINSTGKLTLYQNMISKEEKYVYFNKSFEPLELTHTRVIHIKEQKTTFNEFVSEQTSSDLNDIVASYPQNNRFEFHIKIIPPYIDNQADLIELEEYQEPQDIIMNLKNITNNMDKLKHNTNIQQMKTGIDKMVQYINNAVDFSSLVYGLGKCMENIKTLSNYKAKLKQQFHDDFVNCMTESNSNRIDTTYLNLRINQLFDQLDTISTPEKNNEPSSLSRVVDVGDSELKFKELKSSLTFFAKQCIHLVEQIIMASSKLKDIQLPIVGKLYDCNGEKILSIQYEDEIINALKEAKKYNANLKVLKE
ncbi:MAG TPA: hypothetical protein PLR26_04655 [Bacilli bacterium]|nr:hypothetical protein [Bacilli bacterium]